MTNRKHNKLLLLTASTLAFALTACGNPVSSQVSSKSEEEIVSSSMEAKSEEIPTNEATSEAVSEEEEVSSMISSEEEIIPKEYAYEAKGNFSYVPTFVGWQTESFTYKDSYFYRSGKKDNPGLLDMSICLCLSASEPGGSTNVEGLLTQAGFTGIEAYDMAGKPTEDTIGCAFGYRAIDDYNLIAISVRGEHYEKEWANNFTIGEEGNALGFDTASEKVANRLKAYIESHDLKKNKIWASGYSRAGAVVDLLGAKINESKEDYFVTEDDIYVYAFEPATAYAGEKTYDNIHDVINPNDPIPYFAPREWGFKNAGKLVQLGEPGKIQTYQNLLNPEPYDEADIPTFLEGTMSLITEKTTREKYAKKVQSALSTLIALFMSKSMSQLTDMVEFVSSSASKAMEDPDTKRELTMAVYSAMAVESDSNYKNLANKLIGIVDNALEDPEVIGLTEEEYASIKTNLYPVIRFFGPVVVSDYNPYKEEGKLNSYFFATIFKNARSLIDPHCSNVSFALVREGNFTFNPDK